ncbi:hypothetical protein SRABI106_03228 [Rahnella aquatilis]|nr:hypothetical protein SRABI106_03228 [Rahnella aquatilis]
MRGTVSAVRTEKTAIAVHQAGNQRSVRRRTGDVAAYNAGRVIDIYRFIAVFRDNTLQVIGNFIERLFPANAFKLTFTALADALHRIIQALRMIHAAADRTPAQAGAHLMITVNILPGIVCFDPVHLIITYMQT